MEEIGILNLSVDDPIIFALFMWNSYALVSLLWFIKVAFNPLIHVFFFETLEGKQTWVSTGIF